MIDSYVIEALERLSDRFAAQSERYPNFRHALIPLTENYTSSLIGDSYEAAAAIAKQANAVVIAKDQWETVSNGVALQVFFGPEVCRGALPILETMANEAFDECRNLVKGVMPGLPSIAPVFRWALLLHELASLAESPIQTSKNVWCTWRGRGGQVQSWCLPDRDETIQSNLQAHGVMEGTLRKIHYQELATNVWRSSAKASPFLLAHIEPREPDTERRKWELVVDQNKLIVDGGDIDLEPLETHVLLELATAAEEGDWWRTGPQLQDLPGCRGKKMSKVIKKLEARIPDGAIKHGGNKGYRLDEKLPNRP